MKNNLRKAAAAVAAALMCAVPTVSSLTASAASSTERYTFRTVYYVKDSSNVKINLIVNSWGMNSNGTSSPDTNQIAAGRYYPGGGGAPNYHHAGVNFYPDNQYVKGIIMTQHVFSDSNTLTSNNCNIYAYKADGTAVNNSVGHTDSFLVGDINGDKYIDVTDLTIVSDCASSNMTYNSIDSYVYIGSRRYPAYKVDINNDGRVNSADSELLRKYINKTAKITK